MLKFVSFSLIFHSEMRPNEARNEERYSIPVPNPFHLGGRSADGASNSPNEAIEASARAIRPAYNFVFTGETGLNSENQITYDVEWEGYGPEHNTSEPAESFDSWHIEQFYVKQLEKSNQVQEKLKNHIHKLKGDIVLLKQENVDATYHPVQQLRANENNGLEKRLLRPRQKNTGRPEEARDRMHAVQQSRTNIRHVSNSADSSFIRID